jgi:hypothetical protein
MLQMSACIARRCARLARGIAAGQIQISRNSLAREPKREPTDSAQRPALPHQGRQWETAQIADLACNENEITRALRNGPPQATPVGSGSRRPVAVRKGGTEAGATASASAASRPRRRLSACTPSAHIVSARLLHVAPFTRNSDGSGTARRTGNLLCNGANSCHGSRGTEACDGAGRRNLAALHILRRTAVSACSHPVGEGKLWTAGQESRQSSTTALRWTRWLSALTVRGARWLARSRMASSEYPVQSRRVLGRTLSS